MAEYISEVHTSLSAGSLHAFPTIEQAKFCADEERMITMRKNEVSRNKAMTEARKVEFSTEQFKSLDKPRKLPTSKPITMQWISLAEQKPAAGQEVLACYLIGDEPFIERLTYFEVNDTAITNDIPITPEQIEKELERRPDIVEQLEIVEEAGVPEDDVYRLMITLFKEKTIQEEGFYQYTLSSETGRLHWRIIRSDFEFWMPMPKTPYEK